MTPGRTALALLTACPLLSAGSHGSRAEYVGGTILEIPSGCQGNVLAVDSEYFVFYSKNARWRVPYDKINLIEYGQRSTGATSLRC
jgi:hypothetical protein